MDTNTGKGDVELTRSTHDSKDVHNPPKEEPPPPPPPLSTSPSSSQERLPSPSTPNDDFIPPPSTLPPPLSVSSKIPEVRSEIVSPVLKPLEEKKIKPRHLRRKTEDFGIDIPPPPPPISACHHRHQQSTTAVLDLTTISNQSKQKTPRIKHTRTQSIDIPPPISPPPPDLIVTSKTPRPGYTSFHDKEAQQRQQQLGLISHGRHSSEYSRETAERVEMQISSTRKSKSKKSSAGAMSKLLTFVKDSKKSTTSTTTATQYLSASAQTAIIVEPTLSTSASSAAPFARASSSSPPLPPTTSPPPPSLNQEKHKHRKSIVSFMFEPRTPRSKTKMHTRSRSKSRDADDTKSKDSDKNENESRNRSNSNDFYNDSSAVSTGERNDGGDDDENGSTHSFITHSFDDESPGPTLTTTRSHLLESQGSDDISKNEEFSQSNSIDNEADFSVSPSPRSQINPKEEEEEEGGRRKSLDDEDRGTLAEVNSPLNDQATETPTFTKKASNSLPTSPLSQPNPAEGKAPPQPGNTDIQPPPPQLPESSSLMLSSKKPGLKGLVKIDLTRLQDQGSASGSSGSPPSCGSPKDGDGNSIYEISKSTPVTPHTKPLSSPTTQQHAVIHLITPRKPSSNDLNIPPPPLPSLIEPELIIVASKTPEPAAPKSDLSIPLPPPLPPKNKVIVPLKDIGGKSASNDKKSPPTLMTILLNPSLRTSFEHFLSKEFALESLEFIDDTDAFAENEMSPDVISREAQRIYNEYIRPGSSKEINISSKERMAIKKAIFSLPPGKCINQACFEEVAREIRTLLDVNFLKRWHALGTWHTLDYEVFVPSLPSIAQTLNNKRLSNMLRWYLAENNAEAYFDFLDCAERYAEFPTQKLASAIISQFRGILAEARCIIASVGPGKRSPPDLFLDAHKAVVRLIEKKYYPKWVCQQTWTCVYIPFTQNQFTPLN